MSSRAQADELVALLGGAGVRATTDVRSVVPPCVLVVPPVRTYDLACGYTATWQLYALAPGAGTAGAWDKLDELVDAVAGVLDVETATPSAYQLDAGTPPLPAYLITVSTVV